MEQNESKSENNDVILNEIKNEVSELKDLYHRRLLNDKQKADLLRTVTDGAMFAFVEPFLHDIFLLLDRLEQQNDEFSDSVRDELFEIISRRGVEQIPVTDKFNPELHRAVKKAASESVPAMSIISVVRNGYSLNGKVLRPADVVVSSV
jgi:molecular chaperone GrpE